MIMDTLRNDKPQEIAGFKVVSVADYKTSLVSFADGSPDEKIDLPKSNVLAFNLTDGNKVIVRPSGTEPKIKAYVTAIGNSRKESSDLAQRLVDAAAEFMK